jgi:hypothetical protein
MLCAHTTPSGGVHSLSLSAVSRAESQAMY